MQPSLHNSLNTQDYEKWAKNVIVFASPAVLAGLISLQTNSNFSVALGALYYALLASLIDLVRKFIAGN